MPRNICQMAIKKRIMTAKVIGYMKPDIDPNTRLYVPFNEGVGDLAKDYSQYCNHAQLTDVEWSPDGFNGAGKFNGSSSYGNCGNDASLDISDAITIEAWMKTSDIDEYILAKKDDNDGQYTLYLTPNVPTFVFWDGSQTDVVPVGTTLVNDDKRHYIVVTINETSAKGCTDGKLELSPTLDNTLTNFPSVPVYIGARKSGGTITDPFNGTIDNVIINSTAKSAAQAAADCYEVVCS